MEDAGDGDRSATPGERPTASAPVRPKLPPPPVVGPGDAPPSLGDRTLVTRAPRGVGPTDPKELLPTLRMPPVEARAVRRDVDDLAARLGIGSISEAPAVVRPDATPSVMPEHAVSPVVAAVDAPADAREQQKTVPLPTVPLAPPRERRVHPQARRPPLPLPSVLRAGPRMMSAARMPPAADDVPSERSAVLPGAPEAMPDIDTATLVADCALELLDEPAPTSTPAATDEAEPPAVLEPATPPSSVVAIPRGPIVAERESIAATPATETEPRRRFGWLAIAAAVVALAGLGIANLGGWRDAQEHKPAPPSEASLSARADSGNAPELAVEVAPPKPAIARAPEPPAVPVVPEPVDVPVLEVAPVDAPPSPEPPVPELALQVPPAPALAASAVATGAPPPAEAAPAPVASKSSARKPARGQREPKRASKPAPTPAAKPASTTPPAKADGSKPDAGALLREAQALYAKGNWGAAMRAAQRSQSLRSDGNALQIVAKAACKLQRQDTAQNAFDRLPIGMRKAARTTCRDAGVKLRL